LQFALSKRHEAFSSGATDRTHPLWNASSLIESIATVELASLEAPSSFMIETSNEVRQSLEDFVNRYLSEASKTEIANLR